MASASACATFVSSDQQLPLVPGYECWALRDPLRAAAPPTHGPVERLAVGEVALDKFEITEKIAGVKVNVADITEAVEGQVKGVMKAFLADDARTSKVRMLLPPPSHTRPIRARPPAPRRRLTDYDPSSCVVHSLKGWCSGWILGFVGV